jgi:hypothetical protein
MAEPGRPLEAAAALVPWPVEPDDDLERALAFLGWSVDPGTLARGAHGTGIGTALAAVPVCLLGPVPAVAVPVLALAAGIAVAVALGRGPVALAGARRAQALGAAPSLVARLVLRMRVTPSVEAAAEFAADGQGPLADSLDAHLRAARGSPATGLDAFGEAWARGFPALRRAVVLVAAAGDAPVGRRERSLDRAMDAVLDGTRDRMASFAAAISGPATAVYAFGVLLPLALVAVLPAARVAGVRAGLTAVVLLYDVALPLALVGAAGWLLGRRPITFPPPAVPDDHPDLPGWRRLAPLAGLATGGVAVVAGGRLLPGWLWPLVGAGTAVGTALVLRYRPVVAVHRRVRSVESGLADALSLVGRRISEDDAVEAGIARAGADLEGPTGELFGHAARQGRQLGVGVREAFLGEHGALADLPGPRARSAAALLAVAARQGQPAGSAVLAMADHLEHLRAVEREARRSVRQVTTTLGNTATVFGPLVAGVTVALSGAIGGRSLGPGTAGTLPTAGLGLAVGAYVLLLSGLLAALAAGLERGLDRALVGYRAGLALLSATAVYPTAYLVAAALT